MNINEELYQFIKNQIKTQLSKKLTYDVKVKDTPSGTDFPLVIIQRILSTPPQTDYDHIDSFSKPTYEFDIYAKSKTIGTKTFSARTIAVEIEDVIYEYMSVELGATCTYTGPTPNVDTDVYRITMRFTKTSNDRRNRFI